MKLGGNNNVVFDRSLETCIANAHVWNGFVGLRRAKCIDHKSYKLYNINIHNRTALL